MNLYIARVKLKQTQIGGTERGGVGRKKREGRLWVVREAEV